MIKLSLPRPHVQYSQQTIFRYLELLQLSNRNNVLHLDNSNGERLTVKVLNCLLQEVDLVFKKKLINTTGQTINVKLTEAQAIALYKSLLKMPVSPDQSYLYMILTQWIHLLDKQLSN
jgi:hypothetical protein